MNAVFKRTFACDGEEWLAWVSGLGAYGTGRCSLGSVVAVHFAKLAEPDTPRFEALLAAKELEVLFEDELIALLRSARPIVDVSQLPEGGRRRARSRSLHDHGPPPGAAEL